MKKLSLRSRLIIFFTLIACAVWAAAGVLSWLETKEKTDEFFDTYQMALARQLAATDWSGVTKEHQKKTDRLIDKIRNADDDDEAIGFAVFDADGRMVFHDDENGKDFSFQNRSGSFVNQIVDDEEWRIVWLKSADGKFLIAVGQELEYREDMAWDMLEEFCAPWGTGLLILLLATILIISRELAPLNKLAEDIKNRRSGDLSPLPADNIPSEILPLISAMNQLLAQIENMLERERSFIADSAHELRTPLTALKIQLEVAQMSADDEKTRNQALQKLQLGIERSSRLVEQLLALSKVESSLSAPQINQEEIDWRQTVIAMIDEYRHEAAGKNIAVSYKIEGCGPIRNGNPVLCSLVVRNLLDNAIKYSPEGAAIDIRIQDEALVVTNSGVMVESKHLDKLGQRFYRPAGQNEKGSGLGLSIVRCIAEYYQCRLRFANTDTGFEVSMQSNDL